MNKEKPMVAVTAYGINSICAMNAEPLLQEKGYEMIAFHANGCGGMAMEEFIAQGLLAGVFEFTTHETADEMFGGYCKGIGRCVWRQQANSESLWLSLILALPPDV